MMETEDACVSESTPALLAEVVDVVSPSEAAPTDNREGSLIDSLLETGTTSTDNVSSDPEYLSSTEQGQRTDIDSSKAHISQHIDTTLPAQTKPLPESITDSADAAKTTSVTANDDPTLQNQPNLPLILLSLSIDSLHCIASFSSPTDWASFGQASRGTSRVCRDVMRRVRMHGFRCATEVITAWNLGQLADARELTALYIKTGVPIYPTCLGHSYHTLTWRMGIEARDADSQNESSEQQVSDDGGDDSSTEAESSARHIDRFYSERYEARVNDGYSNSNLTYLEEKCLYWYHRDPRSSSNARGRMGRRLSLRSRLDGAPPPPVLGPRLQAGDAPLLPGFRPRGSGNAFDGSRSTMGLSLTSSHPALKGANTPKITIRAHRHLVDQHLLDRPSVNDDNGAMKTAPVSLSADFFHPQFAAPVTPSVAPKPTSVSSQVDENTTFLPDDVSMDVRERMVQLRPLWRPDNGAGEDDMPAVGSAELPANASASQASTNDGGFVVDDDEFFDPSVVQAPFSNSEAYVPEFESPMPSILPIEAPLPSPPQARPDDSTTPRQEQSILTNVELEIYSAASSSTSFDGTKDIATHLRNRFAVYQRRLDSVLVNLDYGGFEECLLDLWDEFLPITANIHFYDRHTAVPRLACLQKFLTMPCPKAIGIVQCEIERIKVNSKKKGVNMKGRLFPSYEYRLFIRDRRNAPTVDNGMRDESEEPRRDTVLMVAKNRGRKHQDLSGIVAAPGSSKKGVNNYYLYPPQQPDVDAHYNTANAPEVPSLKAPNGANLVAVSSTGDPLAPGLLGRLQSNFIGTEFQIFVPSLRKFPKCKSTARPLPRVCSDSENDLDYDSGVSSDNPSTTLKHRRRRRFSRRSSSSKLLRKSEPNSDHPVPIEEEHLSRSLSPDEHRSLRRAGSWPAVSYGRPSRTSRRAIAHSVDPPDAHHSQSVLCEEEEGAITYTANLLGNRPRIMDVCIPKVSSDGVAGAVWKRYLESCEDGLDNGPGNKMLTRFKQLQQRLENPDHIILNNDGEGVVETDDEYTPPDDFGLLALQNRPPWWNVELGAFVLNFGGRVSVASVKNFQLCDRSNQDHIMLQFGRIQGRHSFTMDFQYPLTAVQAFAIAISSLQSKISFG